MQMNPRSLLATPYRIVRTPLALLNSTVGARLPQESRPRRVLDLALGSTDQFAGRLLGDQTLAEDGARRVDRTEKIGQAADLEAQATERRQAAKSAARSGRQEAADKAREARERAVQGLDEAEQTERRGKQAAAANARTTAAQKKQAAEADAQQRLERIEEGVERTESVANARTTAAKKRAAAKISDADKQRADADSKRSEADDLGELAAAKRTARTRS
jgi:hypothetical protein